MLTCLFVPSSIVQLRLLFPTFFIDGVIKRLKAMIEIMIHSYTHFQGVSASLGGCSAYCITSSRLKPCYIHVSSPPFGRWIASVSSFVWQEHKRQADIFFLSLCPSKVALLLLFCYKTKWNIFLIFRFSLKILKNSIITDGSKTHMSGSRDRPVVKALAVQVWGPYV